VDKNHAQIAAGKRTATEPAAKVAAAALLIEAAEGDQTTCLTDALLLTTSRPSQEKLKAANLSNLVLDQLRLAMQSELGTP
jgi:hypothetical protein